MVKEHLEDELPRHIRPREREEYLKSLKMDLIYFKVKEYKLA
jgi:hypothetical protein